MPDPKRDTISATQVPALFDASPYITKFALYHYLRGAEIETASNSRMDWGLRMQPLLIEQAARDLKLEIKENIAHRYIRSEHGFLGYTPAPSKPSACLITVC